MKSAINSPTDMCIIVTYRCPMQCQMCNIWQNPTDKNKEITPAEIEKLPKVKFINITGCLLYTSRSAFKAIPSLLENIYTYWHYLPDCRRLFLNSHTSRISVYSTYTTNQR